MWLFTSIGFFSATRDLKHPTRIQIRARVRTDLDALRSAYLPELSPVVLFQGTDYPYRAFCEPEELAAAMVQAVMAIKYTNFKSEVTQTQGHARHDLYMGVWSVMRDAEAKLKKSDEERARWQARDARGAWWDEGRGNGRGRSTAWLKGGKGKAKNDGQLVLDIATGTTTGEDWDRVIARSKELGPAVPHVAPKAALFPEDWRDVHDDDGPTRTGEGAPCPSCADGIIRQGECAIYAGGELVATCGYSEVEAPPAGLDRHLIGCPAGEDPMLACDCEELQAEAANLAQGPNDLLFTGAQAEPVAPGVKRRKGKKARREERRGRGRGR